MELDGEKPKKNLTSQYRKDLIDNYMSKRRMLLAVSKRQKDLMANWLN